MTMNIWLLWNLLFLEIPPISTLQPEKNAVIWPKFPEPIDFPEPAPVQWDTTPKPKHGSKHQKGHGHSKAADLLRSSLNQSVDPCDDFYAFTCGKWLANNPIPASETNPFTKLTTHLTVLSNSTKYKLKDMFVNSNLSSSKSINWAKAMFGACMNFDRKNTSALLERINEFGDWPILHGSEWAPEHFNLPRVLAKIRVSLGTCSFFAGSCNIFIAPIVEQNQHNASQQAIYFYQTQLGLKWSENYQNQTKLDEYARQLMSMVKVLATNAGIEFYDERINKEVRKIVNFEKELATILNPYKGGFKELKASFKAGRLSKLAKIVPELNLTEYFKALLPYKEPFHKYFASDPVVFFGGFFFKKLNSLLCKTSKTTLANYVIMRYVMEWSNKQLDYISEDENPRAKDKLEMDCVEWVTNEFKYASGAMYAREFFGNDSKNDVLQMVEYIRDGFRTMFGQNSWMDPITKKRAISKLDKMTPQIGYPDFYLHNSKLDAYYDELKLDVYDPYPSMLKKSADFNTMKQFQKLLAPTDRNEFDELVYVINAFYGKNKNIINIPVSILQAPFYDKSFPKAMNYGGIGMIIGHEFTHGFDDVGSNYDEQGNEKCWWEPETKVNFLKKKQCLIEQYFAYRVPEMNMTINGTRTRNENIADNEGIKEAYKAYQTYLKKLGHEENCLDDLETFTSEQLFFVNFGIIWCGNQSAQNLNWQLSSDSHSPNRYRVNGPLSNMPEFAAAFNCPTGSPMNPKKKCQVW